MQTTYWQTKTSQHQALNLDRRTLLFVAGLAGALFACIGPLPF
ncbi:MAG: hypothetical protein ACAI44_35365 [Candidatus Sericytochromatia bacterium]